VTRLQAIQVGFNVWQGQGFFSLCCCIQTGSGTHPEPTIYFHLVPRLRGHSAIPPLSHTYFWHGAWLSTDCIFMVWYLSTRTLLGLPYEKFEGLSLINSPLSPLNGLQLLLKTSQNNASALRIIFFRYVSTSLGLWMVTTFKDQCSSYLHKQILAGQYSSVSKVTCYWLV
jgi:hypothetical protein